MESSNDKATCKALADLITGGNAHATFDDAIDGLPVKLRGVVPDKLPYSIWQLVKHICITQWDILEFSRDQNHQSPKWPDEYWPKESEPADADEWDKTVAQIKSDGESFIALLNDPKSDLYNPFPHGDGQNLIREALLIGDHTSCHIGEIIVIRRLLGDWKK